MADSESNLHPPPGMFANARDLVRPLAIDDTDSIIHSYHLSLQGGSAP